MQSNAVAIRRGINRDKPRGRVARSPNRFESALTFPTTMTPCPSDGRGITALRPVVIDSDVSPDLENERMKSPWVALVPERPIDLSTVTLGKELIDMNEPFKAT